MSPHSLIASAADARWPASPDRRFIERRADRSGAASAPAAALHAAATDSRPARWASGFTLVELVITVAIIALLATAVVPSARLVYQREREDELKVALRTIRGAIDAYKVASDSGRIKKEADKSGYPPDLQVLVEGVDDARSPKEGVRLYFLRSVPRDPFWPDATTPPAETWGLRSYASAPDDPQPGDDVYDVYSRSGKTGLNGVPYREW